MNKINWRVFDRMSAAKVKEICPAVVTFEGEPMFIIGLPDQLTYIADLHIRVRNQLIARISQARAGLPPPTVLTAEDVKDTPETPEA